MGKREKLNISEEKKQKLEEKATMEVVKARTRMLTGANRNEEPRKASYGFFSHTTMQLDRVVDWEIEDYFVDGKTFRYNPAFVATQCDHETAKGIVSDAALKCCLQHHTMRGERNKDRWNLASALTTNPIILEAGFTLPPGAVQPGKGQFHWLKTTDDDGVISIYNKLMDHMGPPDDGEGEPQAIGGVGEPGDGSSSEKHMSKAQWEAAANQAAELSKGKGDLPGSLMRQMLKLKEPVVDWREVLRDFITRRIKSEYKWSKPNRRYVQQGIYLPSMDGETMGVMVISLDTSGSISDDQLAAFMSEIEGIIGAFKIQMHILYHHTNVYQVQEWDPSEGELVMLPTVSGGTSHIDLWRWVEENGIEPDCFVSFTDLETDLGNTEPPYPVLFAVLGNPKAVAPWGQTLHIDAKELPLCV